MATPRAGLVVAGLALAATGCGQSGEPPSSPAPTAITAPPTGEAGPTSPASPPSPGTAAPGDTQTPTPDEEVGTDAGRTLTAADDGAVVVLRVGEEASLVQQDPQSPDPVVTGDAVEVVEVVNIQASGQRQWALRAVTPGTTELEVTDGDTTFHLAIEVR